MFTNFKLNRRIRSIKKQMTPRERAIFDLIYSREGGVTNKTCQTTLGYKISGWVITKFKELGVDLRVKNKHYYVRGIEM